MTILLRLMKLVGTLSKSEKESLLCFQINGKNLYLDQILTEYEWIPIFFLCKDENQKYLALCISNVLKDKDLHYIVVQLSTNDVDALLNKKCPMSDIILKQKGYWAIESAEDIYEDIVTWHTMKHINKGNLPEEGAYYYSYRIQNM